MIHLAADGAQATKDKATIGIEREETDCCTIILYIYFYMNNAVGAANGVRLGSRANPSEVLSSLLARQPSSDGSLFYGDHHRHVVLQMAAATLTVTFFSRKIFCFARYCQTRPAAADLQ